MNTESIDSSVTPKRPSQITGILIPAIIIIPMVVAYIMFYTGWGVPLATTNKGEFLSPPQQITELKLVEGEHAISAAFAEDAKKRWRIVVPVTAVCVDACADNLYLTRQVHIRLAQKAYRVERILVLLDTLTTDEKTALAEAHPTTMIVQSSKEAFSEWLAPANLSSNQSAQQYYLVDQEGFAMLQYNTQHSGQDLLDDLKKLLKFTYDN